MDTQEFQQFFHNCVGKWEAERTYHYLTYQEVERSRTEFAVKPLSDEGKSKVLADNEYAYGSSLEYLPGFNLGFYTISEKGEEVSQELNLLFVPQAENAGMECVYVPLLRLGTREYARHLRAPITISTKGGYQSRPFSFPRRYPISLINHLFRTWQRRLQSLDASETAPVCSR